MKRPERMSRVSNPRIPIVPVHVPPKNLRQRSGGRSNNSPCRTIDKHLQPQRRAYHLPPPTSIITQLSNPNPPENLHILQLLDKVVLLHLTRFIPPISQNSNPSILPGPFKLVR